MRGLRCNVTALLRRTLLLLASALLVTTQLVVPAFSQGADTSRPSAPTGLVASVAANTQINLAWNTSTDNVAVTGYRVLRCQGTGCTNFIQVGASAVTSFSNTGLTNSTTYRYRVRAVDAAGNVSQNSNTVTVSTDTTSPSAPTTLSAVAVSTSQINLTWSASTDDIGVTGYRLERCQGAGCTNFAQIATPTTTSFNNTGRSAGTSYSYRVRAIDAAGNLGAYSATASATTLDTSLPTTPSNLLAAAVTSGQINLSWTASTDNVGVAGYEVDRCLGAACTNFAQIAAPATPGYSDTAVAAATSYRYRARARDAAGNTSGNSSIAEATTPAASDTQAPTAPAGLTAAAVSGTQINLAWTAATDNISVTGYAVERCLSASCTYAQIGTLPGTAASYSDAAGLVANTGYSYRVRATDAAGNLGPYSNIASVTTPDTTPPAAPTNLVGTAISATQINLSWTASTDNVGVTAYQVDRCLGVTCTNFAQMTTTVTTSFSDTAVVAATTYRYRVRASDAAGNVSANSIIAAAVTPAAPDTQAPTAPGGLVATAVGASQINLGWAASSDNVGVTAYLVEHCVGAGCGDWVQRGTTAGTSYGPGARHDLPLLGARGRCRRQSKPVVEHRHRHNADAGHDSAHGAWHPHGNRGKWQPDQSCMGSGDRQRGSDRISRGTLPERELHLCASGNDTGNGHQLQRQHRADIQHGVQLPGARHRRGASAGAVFE
jgi:chitodextrinase